MQRAPGERPGARPDLTGRERGQDPRPARTGSRPASASRVTGREGGAAGARDHIAGKSTVSITWITPFDCLTSAMVTLATLPWPS